MQADQEYVYFAVTAENEAGESEETIGGVLAGQPYELPIEEHFDGSFAYYWDFDYSGDADWNATSDGQGSYALYLYGEAGEYSALISGMVTLQGASNPIVNFDTKSLHGTPLSIFVETASGKTGKIADVPTTEEFANQSVDLKALVNEDWISVYFVAQFAGSDSVYVDNIVLVDQLNNNLALTLDAPASVTAGAKANLLITVQNLGGTATGDYSVKVYADDKLIDEYTKEVTDELAFLQKAEFVSKFEPSIFSNAGDVTLRAEVVFAADENTADNARNFASMVDGDFLSRLRKTAASEEYQQLRERAEAEEDEGPIEDYLQEKGLWEDYSRTRDMITEYLENMKGIKYLYIVAHGDENALQDMYLVDDKENPIYETGYYEDREAEFYGMDISKLEEPTISYGDWGWLCSDFKPVYASDGTCVCIVGCDVAPDFPDYRLDYLHLGGSDLRRSFHQQGCRQSPERDDNRDEEIPSFREP